jgi:hypothetical protein
MPGSIRAASSISAAVASPVCESHADPVVADCPIPLIMRWLPALAHASMAIISIKEW